MLQTARHSWEGPQLIPIFLYLAPLENCCKNKWTFGLAAKKKIIRVKVKN